MINYNGKIFRAIRNTGNGETSQETRFYYKQNGNIVTAEYRGGKIIEGRLSGIVDNYGNIAMCYQINHNLELMTGKCTSVSEELPNRIRQFETWQWTSADMSSGNSIIGEV